MLAQVQVFCLGPGPGQDLTGNGPGLDLDLTWDLQWDLQWDLEPGMGPGMGPGPELDNSLFSIKQFKKINCG